MFTINQKDEEQQQQNGETVEHAVVGEAPVLEEVAILEQSKSADDCDNCIDGLVGDPAQNNNKVCPVCNGTGKKA